MSPKHRQLVVPKLDIVVNADNVQASLPALTRILRPEWHDKVVLIEEKSDGYCNKNFRCYVAGRSGDDFLLRLVNTSVPNLKERVVSSMKYMQAYKVSAALLCEFTNGLCIEYIPGDSISWATYSKVKEDKIWRSIAREIARYHGLTSLRTAEESNLRPALTLGEDLLKKANDVLLGGSIPKSILDKLPTVDQLCQGRDAIINELGRLGAEKCFCHGDVNPTNIILTYGEHGVAFVDYDCCGIAYGVLDIAWFFQAIIDIQSPSLDDYPTDEEQTIFVTEYLTMRQCIMGKYNQTPSDRDIRYIKLLLRKARLLIYLRMICSAVVLQAISEKAMTTRAERKDEEATFRLPILCWQYYLRSYDEVMAAE